MSGGELSQAMAEFVRAQGELESLVNTITFYINNPRTETSVGTDLKAVLSLLREARGPMEWAAQKMALAEVKRLMAG